MATQTQSNILTFLYMVYPRDSTLDLSYADVYSLHSKFSSCGIWNLEGNVCGSQVIYYNKFIYIFFLYNFQLS